MYWCAGSDLTGPGPDGGAMNSSSCASQPVELVGAKSGTGSAAQAEPWATTAQTRPASADRSCALQAAALQTRSGMAPPTGLRPYRGPFWASSPAIAFPQKSGALL